MAFVETERRGQVMVIRMNRPERLNALGHDLRTGLAEAWGEFRDSDQLEVAVFTGTGRAFCAGADLSAGADTFDQDKREGRHAPRKTPDGGDD